LFLLKLNCKRQTGNTGFIPFASLYEETVENIKVFWKIDHFFCVVFPVVHHALKITDIHFNT